MRRGEDNPAAVDNLVVEGSPAVEDSRVEEGSQGVVEGSPVAVGIPAVVGDNNRLVEVDSRGVVVGSLVGVDNPVAGGNPAAVDNPAVAGSLAGAGIPVAVAGNSLPVAAPRQRSCRTLRRRCCPGLQGFRNWGIRSAAVCRKHCSISVRERYWRHTWGILSIAAFYLSITSITI